MTLAAEAEAVYSGVRAQRHRTVRWPLVCAWAILLVIAAALCIRTTGVAGSAAGAIDVESLEVARELVHAVRSGEPAPTAGGTHDRMPGYALFVAAVALADASVEQGLGCSLADRSRCKAGLFASLFVLQAAAAVAFFAILFAIAWRLCRTWEIVALSLVLAFIAMRLGDFAGLVRPIIWYQLLFAAFALLALVAYQARSLPAAAGSGAALGLAALFEPAAALIVPVAALVLAQSCKADRRIGRRFMLGAALLLCAAIAGLGCLELAVHLSYQPDGGRRHMLRQLAEHLSYGGLDFKTWVLSLVVPIPLIGDWIALAMPQAALRFATGRLGSGATDGMVQLFNEGMTHGGSASGAIGWLLANRVAGDFASYIWALPSIIARGIWAGGGVVALFGLFHVRTMIAHARADGAGGDLRVILLPVLALFVVNALLTANTYWLNPLLPFLYSYAIAYVAAGW
jgi:hypothetical protein